MARRPHPRGFTLVELLVALFILAIVAAMAWQGVDGIVRSRDVSEQRLEKTLRLQSVLAQWEADLGNLQDGGEVPELQFDGASLRLTRRSPEGLRLVVWSLRGDAWTRWSSAPLTRSLALREAWLRSQQLLGNEAGQLRALAGVSGWQLYFWRGNSWSNAQSSSGTPADNDEAAGASGTPPPAVGAAIAQELPQGVRLVLSFADGSGYSGALTRDLRVGP